MHAAHVRFRPIMMTTVAALVGTLPVALATGMGSESRRPLGIAVVGGLAFSQLITLYITPVVYTYLDPLNRRLQKKLAREGKEKARGMSRWSWGSSVETARGGKGDKGRDCGYTLRTVLTGRSAVR